MKLNPAGRADAAELARDATQRWNAKIRWVVAAGTMLVIGLVALPVIALELIPIIGQLLVPILSGILAALATTIALPTGVLVARGLMPVPKALEAATDEAPAGGTSEGDGADDDRTGERASPTGQTARRAVVDATLSGARAAGQLFLETTGRRRRFDDGANRVRTACLVLAQMGTLTPTLLLLLGTALTSMAFVPWVIPTPLSVLVAPGIAAIFLARAGSIRMPLLVDVDELSTAPPPPPVETTDPEVRERTTGKALLERLHHNPIYRRQQASTVALPGYGFVANPDGLRTLRQRFPQLTDDVLARTGIEQLSKNQFGAVRELLRGEEDVGPPRDLVFSGWPGSGRSTVANLWMLGALLQREGAVHCVAAESPDRSVHVSDQAAGRYSARGSQRQFETWISGLDGFGNRMRSCYAAEVDASLDLGGRPDILFTDVRILAERLLGRMTPENAAFLRRLKYVVLDHPDRLTREELTRLRIALARLRMVCEMYGRRVTVIVLLPRMANNAELAKWLLSNANVEIVEFHGWYEPVDVVTWLPAMELDVEQTGDGAPVFARRDYGDEVFDLVVELVVEASHLTRAHGRRIRLAVVDHQPMLGPELRRKVSLGVVHQLSALAHELGVAVTHDVDVAYFGTADLAVDHEQDFDVIVAIGVGPQPERVVMSMRCALARDGVMLLVGDSSTDDTESLRLMREGSFDPANTIDASKLPRVAIPSTAAPVVAFELAGLFDDYRGMALPKWRLSEIFASDDVTELITEWIDEGWVRTFEGFWRSQSDGALVRRTFVTRATNDALAELYALPWGCTTRRVLSVFDTAARATSVVERGRELCEYVDEDRLFVDIYPGAMLRFPPNTVEVEERDVRQLSEEEVRQSRRRYVECGTLRLRQPAEDAIRVERRRLRTHISIRDERPFRHIRHQLVVDDVLTPRERDRAAAIIVAPPSPDRPGDRSVDRAVDREVQRELLARTFQEIDVRQGARVRVVQGSWVCTFEEQIRDVVAARDRLIEDHDWVVRVPVSGARAAVRRTYDATSAVLLFELTDGGARAWDDAHATGARGEKGDDAASPSGYDGVDWTRAIAQRAAMHGFAQLLARWFRRRYLRFDHEFSIDVVPNAEPGLREAPDAGDGARATERNRRPPAYLPWRVVVRARRLGETDDSVVLESVGRQVVDDALTWMHQRLEGCSCDDGCSECCGGLGTIPAEVLARQAADSSIWTDEDAVSRWDTYVLVCTIRGTAPDAVRFRRGSGRAIDRPVTDAELERLRREVIGTASGGYEDGAMHRILAPYMTMAHLEPDLVAPARWFTDEEMEREDPRLGTIAGYYYSSANEVALRREMMREQSLGTMMHEYVHNWQFKVGPERFETDRLVWGEAAPYFADPNGSSGALIIEGLARWVDQAYRQYRGLGPVYRVDDTATWNEYKVGYFFFEKLEAALGTDGLFVWMSNDAERRASLRVRHPKLRSGFSIEEALRAFGLHSEATEGRFDGLDVDY